MKSLNENIFHQYNKWKSGYVRKENSLELKIKIFLDNYDVDASKYSYFRNFPDMTVSEDGTKVNVKGNIRITEKNTINGKLPFSFGKVEGVISFSDNELISSFEGLPEVVEEFSCHRCVNITSLKCTPNIVLGDFDCSVCKNLTSIDTSTEEVKGNFLCFGCDSLTSIEGLPKKIGGYLVVDNEFKKTIILPSHCQIGKGVLGKHEYYTLF